MIAAIPALTESQWGIILALTLFILVLFNISRRRHRNQDGSPRQYRREIDNATQKGAQVQKNLEALLVELNELARVLNGQIDTRFAKLELTIADADRRILELQSLLNRLEAATGTITAPTAHPQIGSGKTPPAALDVIVDDAIDGVPDVAAANRAAAAFTYANGPAPVASDPEPVDATHQAIYDLADQGQSPIEIARRLGAAVGEVELILHLRRRAARSRAAR